VQANYGERALLRVDGVPVGREIGPAEIPLPGLARAETGSIIVIIATNAPLLPSQCRCLAQRATLGLARAGGVGGNSSGDLFLAFSTANRGLAPQTGPGDTIGVRMLPPEALTPLFEAVGEATEEAIVNALCAARTTTGIAGRTAHAPSARASLCDHAALSATHLTGVRRRPPVLAPSVIVPLFISGCVSYSQRHAHAAAESRDTSAALMSYRSDEEGASPAEVNAVSSIVQEAGVQRHLPGMQRHSGRQE